MILVCPCHTLDNDSCFLHSFSNLRSHRNDSRPCDLSNNAICEEEKFEKTCPVTEISHGIELIQSSGSS